MMTTCDADKGQSLVKSGMDDHKKPSDTLREKAVVGPLMSD